MQKLERTRVWVNILGPGTLVSVDFRSFGILVNGAVTMLDVTGSPSLVTLVPAGSSLPETGGIPQAACTEGLTTQEARPRASAWRRPKGHFRVQGRYCI